ncbi:increased DNA methylation 1-like isoform X2 [Salvia divinorum]|uniref:Increased DNA methylation 1-like isoform X2 n=1 Tax=Salvia divinorum TaxID=28513 RepID=A0ABD1GJW6_SALDI
MNMEDSVRSGGGVLKKKSSSGCLIIKKKLQNGNSGERWEGLSCHSNERKRPRFGAGGFGATDEDESLGFMRKVNGKSLHNGSMGYRRSEFGNREYERSNVGIDLGGERRMSEFDLNEFDEDHEFDKRRMREEYLENAYKMAGYRGGESSKDFVIGSSRGNLVADRRHSFHFDGSCSGTSKGGEYTGLRNKGFDSVEVKEEMRVPLLRLKHPEVADEPIRLQGKNGVLKVMLNKKKKMELHSHHSRYDSRGVEEGARCRSEDVPKNGRHVVGHSVSKPLENRGLWMEKEKTDIKLEKVKPKFSKGIQMRESEIIGMSGGIMVREKETDAADTALKLATPGLQVPSSKKDVKKEEERASIENIIPVKGKEGKMKRGGFTEKQLLREKIREMLIDAGWTIDYRPRRNRDYLDAVYISPSGTAYWSIIKAYDALKKQLEEDKCKSKLVIDSPSFAPLAEDLINKLTRQTKKKIEEAMKRKRKEDGLTKSAKRSSGRDDDGESSGSDQNEERLSSCRKQNHKAQRTKFPDIDQGSDGELSNGSQKMKSRKIKVDMNSSASKFNVLQGRTSKVIGRCTLLVRRSDKGENSDSDGYVPYSGKRTVLAWLIDSGVAQLSERVQYMNRRRNRVMLEGWVTRDGIHCGCCSKILTVSKFELHAGSQLRQPFQNIFLESGPSLLQCQVDAWNRQGESVCRDFLTVGVDGDDPDDDACGICGDGGALICCDSCPSTFHQICLEMQMLPSGDWHCPNCICKFCGDSGADELTRCSFCEGKYHKSCSKEVLASSMSLNGASFCGLQCQEFYDHFQKILGVRHELEGGFSWSLIQRTDVSDTSHRGFPQRVESNSKLAVALSVMDECFLPIIDRRSGINMIRNVVYSIGSNFNRLNYCGFYTIILERGEEIVSAASIRIQGICLAEMPFIGTREIYRRKGMCRRLLSAIETELRYLKVERLVIPAISEHMNTWTSVFGFHQLEDGLKKEIKSMNMLVFPGTDMLQKPLTKHSDGVEVSESIKNPRLPKKLDIDSPMECEKQMSYDSGVGHDTKKNDKVGDLDSAFPAPAAPSNNMEASASDSVCESNTPLACNKAMVVNSESEMEENQKEPSASSTVCESKNIDMQNGLQGPPLEDNSPLEGKTEAIRNLPTETLVLIVASRKDTAESTSGYRGSSVKVSEDADLDTPENNGSVLEASSLSATNGDTESSILNERDGCDGEALCIKRSLEVSAKDVSAQRNLRRPLVQTIAPTESAADGENNRLSAVNIIRFE